MCSDRNPSRPGHRRGVLAAASLAVLPAIATACGSTGTAPADAAATEETTSVAFDPADFVDPTLDTNPFHPLKPGTQWTYGGTTEIGARTVPHGIVVTMTDVVREIDGAPAVAMLAESTDAGEVAQVGMDYLGLDRDGNVWILGGYTEEYEGGEYTNTENAWLGEAEDQEVGILAPSEVTVDTPRWFIGAAPDEAGSIGEPVEVDASTCVSFGCFDGVRVVMEGEVGAPDNEHKFYAPGAGVVNNVPLDASLHKDRFELLNLVQLGESGIAAASQVVLDLEAHALETAPDVYGSAPTAQRTS